MSSPEPGGARAPSILCAGIIVLDEVFQVERFPEPDGKVQAKAFFAVNGGCAANAAVAIARLGGRASLCGPLGGPQGADENGDRVLAALEREGIDCRDCVRVAGLASPLSAIFIDAHGDRMIVTYRDERIATAQAADPERDRGVGGCGAGRQPVSGIRPADLPGGPRARHHRRARRRQSRPRCRTTCSASPRM